MKGKRFDDAVATGCWYVDLHPNKTTVGGANDVDPKKVQPEPYDIPYRSLLPQKVDNLLVAGRHYSATSSAQKMSREIPPCMAMGEAAGVAAALALDAGVTVRDVDVKRLQIKLRAQGADPGDQSGPNADVPPIAASVQREAA